MACTWHGIYHGIWHGIWHGKWAGWSVGWLTGQLIGWPAGWLGPLGCSELQSLAGSGDGSGGSGRDLGLSDVHNSSLVLGRMVRTPVSYWFGRWKW